MLKRRLIPKLLLKTKKIGPQSRLILVTTHQFDNALSIGDPISQAKIYQAQMADELILLDLDAKEGLRKEFITTLHLATEQIFMPITAGGGVRTLDDFKILLANGADKISINSAALKNPSLIEEAAKRFGTQCVVVSIDYKTDEDGNHFVWTEGGKIKTPLSPFAWAKEAEKLGAGELLLTSIDRDGSCQGLDIAIAKAIADEISIPVILSGGCGLATHFIEGLKEANAAAIAAGTFFCFKDQNPMQTRAHIKNAGINIRIQN